MKIELNAPLITEKEAARMLGLNPDTLKARRLKGQGPCHFDIGMGRKPVIRYSRNDIAAYIDACRSTSNMTEAAHA